MLVHPSQSTCHHTVNQIIPQWFRLHITHDADFNQHTRHAVFLCVLITLTQHVVLQKSMSCELMLTRWVATLLLSLLMTSLYMAQQLIRFQVTFSSSWKALWEIIESYLAATGLIVLLLELPICCAANHLFVSNQGIQLK